MTPDPKKRRLRDPRPFRDDENMLAPPSTRELAEMQAREELDIAGRILDLANSIQHDQPLVSNLLHLMWEKVIHAAKMVDRPARGRPKGSTLLSANEIETYRRDVEAAHGRPATQEQVADALQRSGLAVTTRMIGRIHRAQFGRWPTG